MLLSVKVDLLIYFFLKKNHTFSSFEADYVLCLHVQVLLPLLSRNTPSMSDAASLISWGGIFQGAFVRGAEWQRRLLQSLSCAQQMIPRRWRDEVCEQAWKLCCGSPLRHWLSLPDPRCILPNKCFSSLRSSDYTLHWIQIKRQNVSLISTVMWDR